MDTQKFLEAIPEYLEYLNNIGYCKCIIAANMHMTNKLTSYCLNNKLKTIDMEVMEKFSIEILKVNELKGTYKYVMRRAVRGLFDYTSNEKIKFCYQKEKIQQDLNCNVFKKLLDEYINNFIIKQYISESSKKRKIRVITKFLNYLTENNVSEISLLTEVNVINYLHSIENKYNKETLSTYIGIIKEFSNYLYNNNLNNNYLIQSLKIVNRGRKPSPECFNKQELQQILNSIDVNKPNGKFHFVIILLLATYGLRIGDILKLKFENIDFEKNAINIIQLKTKNELSLYLTEQVKFAILNYIKNERPKNISSQYIFVTLHKPYRPFNSCAEKIIRNIIKKANVNIENKIIGSRIFRHSLATNMINDNVPLNNIQSILGHTNSKVTAKYITRDINKLSLLTLEVPENE